MEQDSHAVAEEKPLTLSDHLRAWRAHANLSVEEIAAELSVRPQIIRAFEEGDYDVFPARVYAAGYLRCMVDHFTISAGDTLAEMLKTEWDQAQKNRSGTAVRALPKSRRQRMHITPRRLLSAVGGMVFLFFCWVLVIQLVGFTGAPDLRIDEPSADALLHTPIVRVKGSTEKESQLTVNGREITLNGNGAFDQEIELPAGVNALDFLAQNRFGKISQETRYVVVR